MPLYPPSPASGAAFPGSPATNSRVFRTDLGMEFYYSGTRWLSTQALTLPFAQVSATVTSLAFAPVPFFGAHSLWLETLDTTMFRSAAAPDEWDIVLSWISASNVATAITTIDGSADAAATWIPRSTALGVVLDAAARAVRVGYTEIDDGSTLTGAASLRYRVIAT